MKKISFCITCMNRLGHLQKTLEKNILDNFLVDAVEFVVLDYNSQDGLEEWMSQSMMKYIELGVLVYYRTDEPIHYLRSHSRNMVFRLAYGNLVCNLDADNYLGKGFAEFMLKEFRDKKDIFYTSNLCYRDVFGRVCLNKKDFVAIRGYNEIFAGYGLEDIELFNRLHCSGLERNVFNQREFYDAVMHTDNERISQESLLKDLHSIYLDYIDPNSTRVLMLYKEQLFGMGVIKNNVVMNYNQTDETDRMKQCMSDKDRLIIKGKWEEGSWNDTGNEIVLSFEDKNLLFSKDLDRLCYCHRLYYKVIDTGLIIMIVMAVTEAWNYLKMKEITDDCKNINPMGFGRGVVYKNFDYNNEIILS